MAIAHTNIANGNINSSTNTTSYTSASAGQPTAGAHLVAFVAASGTVAAAPTFSGYGATWTLTDKVAFNGGADTLYFFEAEAGAAPSSTQITFDCTGDAATGCAARAQEITSAVPTKVQLVKSAANQTSANPTVTLAALSNTSDNLVIFAFGQSGVTQPAGTAGTNYLEKYDVSYATPTTGLYIESGLAISDNTPDVTMATTLWAGMAVEFGPAVNATATPSAVAAVSAVPAPTVKGTAVVTPSTVAGVAAVPAPTVIVPTDITATPSAVAAVAAVPAPSPAAAAKPTPSTVAGVAAVPSSTVLAAAKATPSAVAAVSAVPAPTLLAGTIASPSAVQAIAYVAPWAKDGVGLPLPVSIGSSGTGPGPATAPSPSGSEFDITDYGAVIDGATDDWAAWDAAITAATASGGTVLHPGGTSALGDHLTVPSGVTIAGIGPTSIVKALAGLSSDYALDLTGVDGVTDVNNVTIRDLAFDLNTVASAGAMVYRNTDDLLVDRCTFSNSAWYYIHEQSSFADGLTPLASNITIRDCTFDTHTGGSRECVIAGYVNTFTLLRCRFVGTNLGFSIYRAAFDTLVQDCDFDTITGTNPNAIIYGRGCDGITITNCSFTDVGTTGSAAIRGCQPQDDYISNGGLGMPDYVQDVSITQCTFDGCGVAYQVGAVVGFTDQGNLIENSLGTGVLVNSGNTSVNFTGYPSRTLSWYGTKFLSNMQTGGAAALLFNSTQAGVNLDASVRRCLFDDAGATQTRSVCFQGNNVAASSVFADAWIDDSNTFTHPTQAVYLINSASGIAQVTTPTVLGTAVASPATVAALAAVPLSTILGSATANPDAVAAIVAVLDPTVVAAVAAVPTKARRVVSSTDKERERLGVTIGYR